MLYVVTIVYGVDVVGYGVQSTYNLGTLYVIDPVQHYMYLHNLCCMLERFPTTVLELSDSQAQCNPDLRIGILVPFANKAEMLIGWGYLCLPT